MQDAKNPYQSPLQVKIETTTNSGFSLLEFATRSRIAFGIAVFPAVAMVVLFHSLAIHMHLSLGAWPTSVGERGFPSSLVTHACFAQLLFTILFFSCLAWTPTFVVCIMVDRWLFLIKYLIAFAASCIICAVIMSLAPSQFLVWWWD